MVVNRHRQEALLVHLDDDSLLAEPGIRRALATALYRDLGLFLGQAAQSSRLSLAEFIQHLSQSGLPVIGGTSDTVREDAETIVAWRSTSSQPPRAR